MLLDSGFRIPYSHLYPRLREPCPKWNVMEIAPRKRGGFGGEGGEDWTKSGGSLVLGWIAARKIP